MICLKLILGGVDNERDDVEEMRFLSDRPLEIA